MSSMFWMMKNIECNISVNWEMQLWELKKGLAPCFLATSSKHCVRPPVALISLTEPLAGEPLALPTDDPLARRRLPPRPDRADKRLLLLVLAQATTAAEEKWGPAAAQINLFRGNVIRRRNSNLISNIILIITLSLILISKLSSYYYQTYSHITIIKNVVWYNPYH
jgi:hypothetical protein